MFLTSLIHKWLPIIHLVLFLWLVSWAAMSIIIAKYFHKKEERWLALKRKGDAEIARAMTLEGANEIAIEASRRRKSEHQARRSMSNSRRMSERHTNEFRNDIREQLARRAATENDVTAAKQFKKEKERKKFQERNNAFDPGLHAIPSRQVEDNSRLLSPGNASGELPRRIISPGEVPQRQTDDIQDTAAMHVVQSR